MEIKEQILARMYVGMTLLGLIPFLIVVQLVRIYWFEGAELRSRGEQQATLYETVPAMRGAIMDRNGRVLAVNEARYDLVVDGTSEDFSEHKTEFVEKLSAMVDRDPAHYYLLIRQADTPRAARLARRLTEEQKLEIESWNIPGVRFRQEISRRYTYGALAGQVLGYVAPSEAGLRGMIGVEAGQDDHLRGIDGRRPMQKNRRGDIRPVPGAHVVAPQHGGGLELTIDLARQTIMEEELLRGIETYGARWGTAVAMDPKTGEILAMANGPVFDPNRPTNSEELAQTNFSVQSQIEPGSTFKIVTAIAAVDLGKIHLADTVDTGTGVARYGNRTMRDDHVIGRAAFVDVIAQSSNVGTASVATSIEPGIFYQYARNLGFGQYTWIDLPGEAHGTLNSPRFWSGTSQAWMSHGYEVDVSPIQLLAAFSTLANGGKLMQPYIVSARTDVEGNRVWEATPRVVRQVFQPETAKTLMPAFERVVEQGTAKVAYVDRLRIAGKTGTAKKVEKGVYTPGAYRASFVGLFPADDPVVAMVVVLDEPMNGFYGGDVAAPIFRRIAERWIGTFPAVSSRMAPPEALPVVDKVAVPNVLGIPASVANGRISAAGLTLTPSRSEQWLTQVTRQDPPAGSIVPRGTEVVLTTDTDPAHVPTKMPDLRGMTVRQAVNWMTGHGVTVQIKGSGRVRVQSPRAGTPMPARAVLECR